MEQPKAEPIQKKEQAIPHVAQPKPASAKAANPEQKTETDPSKLPVFEQIHLPEKKPASKPAIPALKTESPKVERKDDNVVFIGKNGVMGYVLAVVTCFNRGAPEVTIKARGVLISRAVDVALIVKRRFMPDMKTKEIKIMTEDLQSRAGQQSNVSAIEIVLAK